MPLSPGRHWLFRLVALLVLPLLLLGGVEAVLRLAGYGYAPGFFKSVRLGDTEYWVDNADFSRRFFPPQLARWPDPVMLAAHKPAHTYRVFVLGESAARGEPEPNYSAARYLEALLDQRFPNTHFEMVNLGITAIDSHVILPIARDCARAVGDLWIVYMGNNEMVGPFGAATVFGQKAPPLGFVRLNLAIQKTRLGQLLADLGRRLGPRQANAAWGGMKMFAANQLRADDPRKEVVYQNFARNLDDILRSGLNSGAKILLNTVAVNLRDCPPFASLVNSNLPGATRAQFDQWYAGGSAAEAAGHFAAAAEEFARAAKLDPQYPELQYRWGKCLLALTNAAAARAHFQIACDDDALPFRADSRINRAIAEAGRRYAGDQLTLFDAAAALADTAPENLCGQETFYEHVHFTFDGNYHLARAWAEQVEKMLPGEIVRGAATNGWASQEMCERRLGLTDWNRRVVTETVMDRLQHAPLSGQANNAERLLALRQEAGELRRRMNPLAAAQAADLYQAALQRSPQDPRLVENFADFLELTGDLKAAATQWRRECELLPQASNCHYQYGRLLNALGQWTDAEAALTTAVMLRPRLTEAWAGRGSARLATERFEPALQDFQRAVELDPQDATDAAYLGRVLAKLNRHAEAIQYYRQALQLQPDMWAAHFALGDELAAASQFDRAAQEYAEVIRLQPAYAVAHLNLGVMQARLGRLDEALGQFAETLRLEPDNGTKRCWPCCPSDWSPWPRSIRRGRPASFSATAPPPAPRSGSMLTGCKAGSNNSINLRVVSYSYSSRDPGTLPFPHKHAVAGKCRGL